MHYRSTYRHEIVNDATDHNGFQVFVFGIVLNGVSINEEIIQIGHANFIVVDHSRRRQSRQDGHFMERLEFRFFLLFPTVFQKGNDNLGRKSFRMIVTVFWKVFRVAIVLDHQRLIGVAGGRRIVEGHARVGPSNVARQQVDGILLHCIG